MEPDYFDVKVSFIVSLLAWPILYIFDNGFEKVDPNYRTLVMMSVGFVILLVMISVLAKISKLKDWMGYVFMLFAFTSMIDLIIALEFHGYIGGFMSQYLQLGEPYLHSPWGSAISLFDGTGFYIMYLVLIHLISNGKNWRSLGIYWASAIINSMIVLLFGVFTGNHRPTFCTFLNIPYALVPLIILVCVLKKENPSSQWKEERNENDGLLFNLVIAIGLLFTIWITFVKGMLSLGSTFNIFSESLKHEPALLDVDPAPFAKIQSLVFLFYSVPIQILTLFYIFQSKRPQILWDAQLLNAGMLLQAQFSFIFTALDPQTNAELRSDFMDRKFWADNLTILIVPHVVLWMLYKNHCQKTVQNIKTKGKHN